MKIPFLIFAILANSILFSSFIFASQTKIITVYSHTKSIDGSDLQLEINRIREEMLQKSITSEIKIIKSYPGNKEWKVLLIFPETAATSQNSTALKNKSNANQKQSLNSVEMADSTNTTITRLSNSLGASVYVTPKLHVH